MNKALSPIRRAVRDYDMIKDGDRICVGVSGGKDSVLLLAALHRLSTFYPNKFEVVGYSIDSGFGNTDFGVIADLCRERNIEYHVEKTDIYEIVFNRKQETNPCSLCAMLRRGALCNGARSVGANVLALGHHNDDVIDTFVMNLINGGRLGCFQPITDYDDGALRLIRPLIYMKETEIKSCVKRCGLPIVKSTCPMDGNTERKRIHDMVAAMEAEHHGAKKNIFGALRRAGIDEWKV